MPLKRKRHSLGARPLTEIQLSGSLLELAFKVWETRETIKKPFDVYKLYASITGSDHKIQAGSSSLSHYFACLAMLAKKSGLKIKIQDFECVPYTTMVNARYNYINQGMPITCPRLKFTLSNDAERNNMTIEDYHITRMQAARIRFSTGKTFDVMHRVYLNVKNNKAVKVMTYVVFDIILKIEGVRSAKIGIGNFSDTIVIYTKNRLVSNKVVFQLQKYQLSHGVGSFRDELPAMTKRHMPGVSSGAQPPDIHFEQRLALPKSVYQSFGGFRSDLIYQALKDSTENYDFFELIVKYFRDAGIDANDPSIQSNFQHLEQQARINLLSNLMANHW